MITPSKDFEIKPGRLPVFYVATDLEAVNVQVDLDGESYYPYIYKDIMVDGMPTRFWLFTHVKAASTGALTGKVQAIDAFGYACVQPAYINVVVQSETEPPEANGDPVLFEFRQDYENLEPGQVNTVYLSTNSNVSSISLVIDGKVFYPEQNFTESFVNGQIQRNWILEYTIQTPGQMDGAINCENASGKSEIRWLTINIDEGPLTFGYSQDYDTIDPGQMNKLFLESNDKVVNVVLVVDGNTFYAHENYTQGVRHDGKANRYWIIDYTAYTPGKHTAQLYFYDEQGRLPFGRPNTLNLTVTDKGAGQEEGPVSHSYSQEYQVIEPGQVNTVYLSTNDQVTAIKMEMDQKTYTAQNDYTETIIDGKVLRKWVMEYTAHTPGQHTGQIYFYGSANQEPARHILNVSVEGIAAEAGQPVVYSYSQESDNILVTMENTVYFQTNEHVDTIKMDVEDKTFQASLTKEQEIEGKIIRFWELKHIINPTVKTGSLTGYIVAGNTSGDTAEHTLNINIYNIPLLLAFRPLEGPFVKTGNTYRFSVTTWDNDIVPEISIEGENYTSSTYTVRELESFSNGDVKPSGMFVRDYIFTINALTQGDHPMRISVTAPDGRTETREWTMHHTP